MGRGIGHRLIAAAIREETEDEERRCREVEKKTDNDHVFSDNKENQSRAPRNSDINQGASQRSTLKAKRAASRLSVDAKRRVTRKPKLTIKDDDPEKKSLLTQIRKDQFISFRRWFTTSKSVEIGGWDYASKQGSIMMAVFFNSASPDYLVGATIWWCGQQRRNLPTTVGLRITTQGEIIMTFGNDGNGIGGGSTVHDDRVAEGVALLVHALLISSPVDEDVATFTTIEEWKDFVKADGPEYNGGGKLALVEEVPDWLLDK